MSKILAGVLALFLVASEEKVTVTGEYVEARSCDVWTGPCFSNAEALVTGDLAIVGWSVDKGAWNGVRLDGRKIVAVLDADNTFMTDYEGRVVAGVYIDRQATAEQAGAILEMARAMAPHYLKNVVKIERRDIVHTRDGLSAKLEVGEGEVRLATGLLGHCDTVCGNESQAYGPFSGSVEVKCAKALANAYRGTVLADQSWSYPDRRSAMVGRFAR